MSKNASAGRYRRAYPRIWRHPDFQQLTPAQRNIALYLLTGPQTNRIGLFHFSTATAAEDLLLGADTCRAGVRDVCMTFGWVFDGVARVLFIPSWWRWNCPENKDVLRGNLKDLSEIPPCALINAFAQHLEHVPPDLQDTFIETCRTRVSTRQVPQEQEQESVTRTGTHKRAGFDHKTRNDTTRGGSEVSVQLVAMARETLRLSNPNGPLQELVDAFQCINRSGT